MTLVAADLEVVTLGSDVVRIVDHQAAPVCPTSMSLSSCSSCGYLPVGGFK